MLPPKKALEQLQLNEKNRKESLANQKRVRTSANETGKAAQPAGTRKPAK
jgi:hypothetical protein